MKIIFFISLFLLLSTISHTTIINIPDDYPTIQAGIDAAVDTDTVLVQPGTYYENINYNGNNITVASLFLTTQDTTYISQTIIDGNESGRVVTFYNNEDSTAVLSGFKITNGQVDDHAAGGGIACSNSSPSLQNVIISDNSAGSGGGIYCESSSPSLENVTITGNSAYGTCCATSGGGIYCSYNSSPSLENVTIIGNSAWESGGGIVCYYNSNPILENVTITGNSAASVGGGICCWDNSNPSLINVTITGNSADRYGGGIHCWVNSSLSFDPVERCNIFLNLAGSSGCDLYAYDCPTIDVIVDTFTVLQPYDYFACPIDNFSFDILNARVEQVDQDLYVSPDGSNNNSGLTVDDPLLTVSYALVKILPDSTNTLTIHLSNGTYSPSVTGEIFPLYCRSYVSLLGEDEAILDADSTSRVLGFYGVTDATISNITITSGYALSGGGIYCDNSSPILQNVTIINNFADGVPPAGTGFGGGICCVESSPSLENVTISGNSAPVGGGIFCAVSSPSLENVTISDNSGSGISCFNNSSPELINCIMWNDTPQEIDGSATVTYSDIQGGWEGTGNIDQDPLFVGTGEHPFSLLEASPCIDAGIPDTEGLNLPPWDIIGNERIWDGDGDGIAVIDMGAYEYGAPPYVDIEDNVIIQTPEVFLHQNYPNPFNPITTISFQLSELSDQEDVELVIYNIKGQKVKDLTNSLTHQPTNRYSVTWDGTDDYNQPVSSGIYFYKLKTGKDTQIRKMILLR
jgi:predicted outer membrane repeat protein